MAADKYDVVVEGVHYEKDGKIKWVRVYERRGAIFSDRLIWNRDTLVERLKKGRKVYAGKRIPLLAGTFEVSEPIRLIEDNGNDFIVDGQAQVDHDQLNAVPLI